MTETNFADAEAYSGTESFNSDRRKTPLLKNEWVILKAWSGFTH
jgi:hypothetical protein